MLDLILYFSLFSLISVGGVNTVLPELYRVAVELKQWVTPAEFTQLFAVSQAAPGPNVLIVALLGWKAAGLPGALAATAAICVPSGILALWVGSLWDRVRDAPWRQIVQRALLPVVVGLVLASGYVIAAPGGPDWRTALIVLGSAVPYSLTRIHPMWLLAAGGVLGAVLLG